MEAKISYVFNVYGIASTESPVQEAVKHETKNKDDDGIKYSPNPNTLVRDDTVVALLFHTDVVVESSQSLRR